MYFRVVTPTAQKTPKSPSEGRPKRACVDGPLDARASLTRPAARSRADRSCFFLDKRQRPDSAASSGAFCEGVSRVPLSSLPLPKAEAAGIRTRHGRRRWMEDDPFLLKVNASLGIYGKRYGEGVHESWFDLAY